MKNSISLKYKLSGKSFYVNGSKAEYSVTLERQLDMSGNNDVYPDHLYLNNLSKEQYDKVEADTIYELTLTPEK